MVKQPKLMENMPNTKKQTNRIVIISADKNTDYCYLNMSKESAIEQFKQNEDYENMYAAAGIDALHINEIEFESAFMVTI